MQKWRLPRFTVEHSLCRLNLRFLEWIWEAFARYLYENLWQSLRISLYSTFVSYFYIYCTHIICVYIYTHACMHTIHIYIYIYGQLHTCMHIYIYKISTWIHTYIYIYTYVYTSFISGTADNISREYSVLFYCHPSDYQGSGVQENIMSFQVQETWCVRRSDPMQLFDFSEFLGFEDNSRYFRGVAKTFFTIGTI